jgi:hypothetical protein
MEFVIVRKSAQVIRTLASGYLMFLFRSCARRLIDLPDNANNFSVFANSSPEKSVEHPEHMPPRRHYRCDGDCGRRDEADKDEYKAAPRSEGRCNAL